MPFTTIDPTAVVWKQTCKLLQSAIRIANIVSIKPGATPTSWIFLFHYSLASPIVEKNKISMSDSFCQPLYIFGDVIISKAISVLMALLAANQDCQTMPALSPLIWFSHWICDSFRAFLYYTIWLHTPKLVSNKAWYLKMSFFKENVCFSDSDVILWQRWLSCYCQIILTLNNHSHD